MNIPVNETKVLARWMLSQALAKVERGEPGSAGDMDGARPYFRDYIESIKVAEETARMVQRRLAAIVAADVVRATAISPPPHGHRRGRHPRAS